MRAKVVATVKAAGEKALTEQKALERQKQVERGKNRSSSRVDRGRY